MFGIASSMDELESVSSTLCFNLVFIKDSCVGNYFSVCGDRGSSFLVHNFQHRSIINQDRQIFTLFSLFSTRHIQLLLITRHCLCQ